MTTAKAGSPGQSPERPLAGVRVIEFGTLIAGPFCTRILAEFGAEVIKIESPRGGDPLRKWRKLQDGTSLWWYVQARNKKSLTLDLKDARGVEIARRLIGSADILVENFRPGVMEKLGIGFKRAKIDGGDVQMLCKNGKQIDSRNEFSLGCQLSKSLACTALVVEKLLKLILSDKALGNKRITEFSGRCHDSQAACTGA